MAAAEQIRFTPYRNLVTGFTRGNKRCLRIGSDGGTVAQRRRGMGHSIKWPEHCVCLVPPDNHSWLSATVYAVSLSPEFHARYNKQPKNFMAVAMHDGAVKAYLEYRYGNVIKRYSGLARYTLGLAMQKLSTRNEKLERDVSSKARAIAGANIRIISRSGAVYTVTIADDLFYAAAALRGGGADVDLAMKKAANQIAGRIMKVAGSRLDAPMRTPFPEVKGKR